MLANQTGTCIKHLDISYATMCTDIEFIFRLVLVQPKKLSRYLTDGRLKISKIENFHSVFFATILHFIFLCILNSKFEPEHSKLF